MQPYIGLCRDVNTEIGKKIEDWVHDKPYQFTDLTWSWEYKMLYEECFKSKVTLFTKLVKKKIELQNNFYWIPREISYFST